MIKKLSKASFIPVLLVVLMGGATVYAAGPAVVNLGMAGNYVILSKSGISTVPTSAVTGDIAVSPIGATSITGFGLIADGSNIFSTSAQVTGKVYAANYTSPTPTNLTTAISNMETAYVDAMGRAATVTELGAGNIGGLTLAPGVYKWGTGVTIPTNLTLSGSANDVWIFQIAQGLNVAGGKSVILSGGAKPENVFWVVAGQVTLGTNSHFEGIVLSQTAIHLLTGASVKGGLFAQTAVTLDSNIVTKVSFSQAPVVVSTTTLPTTTLPSTSESTQTPVLTSTSNNTSGYNPGTSNNQITQNTQTVVCPMGDVFNMADGKRCTSFVSSVVCPIGQVFSIVDGKRCTSFVASSGQTLIYNVSAMARSFDSNLTMGNRNEDVFRLQQYLNNNGFTVSLSGSGSKGNETNFFGPLTKAALKSFQEAYRPEILTPLGLQMGTGFFGNSTRAFINSR